MPPSQQLDHDHERQYSGTSMSMILDSQDTSESDTTSTADWLDVGDVVNNSSMIMPMDLQDGDQDYFDTIIFQAGFLGSDLDESMLPPPHLLYGIISMPPDDDPNDIDDGLIDDYDDEIMRIAAQQYYSGSEVPRELQPTSKVSVENLEKVKIIEKGEVTCSICLDEISLGSEAVCTPCLHSYHENCIIQWFQNGDSCPLCRRKLS